MVLCVLMAAWLAGTVPVCAADSTGTGYREASPVVDVIPPLPAVPAGKDPYERRTEVLVDVILGVSGVAALYLTAQKLACGRRNRSHGRATGHPAGAEMSFDQEPLSAAGEMVENRRARRGWHAAEIERLLRRL